MPDIRSLFDKAFLYNYDLQGRDVTVTIRKVVGGTVPCSDGTKKKMPVLFFEKSTKGFGCNITNVRSIAAMYGTFDYDKWVGKRITLFPTTCQMAGQVKDCIRIRPNIPGTRVADGKIDETAVADQHEAGSDDSEEAVV